jgi:hypothetical protein
MKIKFLADVKVKDHAGVIEFQAIAGETKDLTETSAARWIKRHLATECEKEESAQTVEAKPTKAKAKAGA